MTTTTRLSAGCVSLATLIYLLATCPSACAQQPKRAGSPSSSRPTATLTPSRDETIAWLQSNVPSLMGGRLVVHQTWHRSDGNGVLRQDQTYTDNWRLIVSPECMPKLERQSRSHFHELDNDNPDDDFFSVDTMAIDVGGNPRKARPLRDVWGRGIGQKQLVAEGDMWGVADLPPGGEVPLIWITYKDGPSADRINKAFEHLRALCGLPPFPKDLF